MFSKIRSLLKKEETYSCIVWDGKMMKYLSLTQKEIDNINTQPEYEGWTVTKKDEC